MTRTILIAVMIISWVLFVASVLLMSPKGWVGFWIGWAESTNEYWSKKSIETTLKKVAAVCSVIFITTVLFLPYTK